MLAVLQKCQWHAQSSFLANEVAESWIGVEDLVVLQKWTFAVGGSHPEGSGGDLGCEGAHLLGSLSLLEMNVEEFVVLQK